MPSSTPWKSLFADLPSPTGPIRIHYLDAAPPAQTPSKGTLLLLHGFPQTSHQFRHVISPLAQAGYRVMAPDYRGAGLSSHPLTGFTKSIMAGDLVALVHEHLGITDKIHVVGHDIGGMVAHAYAVRWPAHVASVVWGECPLPGTGAYEANARMAAQFHFVFHTQVDLAVALVQGREGVYVRHFFDKLARVADAIPEPEVEVYVRAYERPGALRCAFEVYNAFGEDKRENEECLAREGRCKVPALAFSGAESRHSVEAKEMVTEMYESVEVATVEGSGHYLAEENPEDFVTKVLDFVGRH